MEIRNVIELSAFSKSLSKKITYLNHKERILILAILSVGQTKSGVKKETKGADGKVTVAFVPEITCYKVICGSIGLDYVLIPKSK